MPFLKIHVHVVKSTKIHSKKYESVTKQWINKKYDQNYKSDGFEEPESIRSKE